VKPKSKPKNTNLYLALTVILCGLLALITSLLFIQNRQLTTKISFLSQKTNTFVRENKAAVSVEQIRSTAEVIDWTLTEDDLSINEKYKISFRYPAKLISSVRSINGKWTYSFFESVSKKEQHQKCTSSKDPKINWEGSCDSQHILFEVVLSEDNNFDIGQHTSNLEKLENGSHQIFTTSPDAFGGIGDMAIFESTTLEQNNVIRIGLVIPSQLQYQRIEPVLGSDPFTFFKKLLSTLEID